MIPNIGEETERIEFKKSTGEMKDAIISIAAILNKHGAGELFFGVKDNGDVIGQDIVGTTLRDVSQAVGYHIKPPIYPQIEKREIDGKQVVYVKFEGNRAPYTAYNIPRIRVADEDKVMNQAEYDRLLRIREDSSRAWELQVSKKTVNEIIVKDFKRYLNKAKAAGRIDLDSDDPAVVMKKLELMDDDGVHLLNAGALLFCRTDLADVQMAKFATDVKKTFTDIRREDFGSIIGQIEVCVEYLVNAMDWKADIIGFDRVETPEVPVEAIREAVINSYGHRTYNNNQNNEIDVFKDRIEIHTTGGFPEGHTPEEFLTGDQKPIRRNRLITRILYFSKDMETFATGLKRIKELCDEAGCKVEFRLEKDDFVVVFYRNLRKIWNKDSEKTNELPENQDSPDGSIQRVPRKHPKNIQKTSRNLSENIQNLVKPSSQKKRDEIISIIKGNPKISQAEIADSLRMTIGSVKHHINKMKEDGIMERVGSDNGGYWKIKDV